MSENKSVKKNPLWEARRLLAIKRNAVRRREDSLAAMRAEVRTLEKTVESLEGKDGN